jgi:hypothetical protein
MGTGNGDNSGRLEEEDYERAMETGVRGQRLVINGWFASHADSGTPGPHVRLWAGGVNGAVLRTEQIPELVDNINAVRAHIDRQWNEQGEEFLAAYDYWIDANDPDVIRQRRIDHLDFLDKLRSQFSQVAAILLEADDIHAASAAIAPLLGVDELDVEIRLNGISLFSLTRTPSAARAERLRELRQQP